MSLARATPVSSPTRSWPAPTDGYAMYPAGRSHRERLRYLLQFTAFAPTLGASVPFRFRIADEGVELLAGDRDRASTLSAGAALHHLRIAFEAFGEDAVVEEFPSGPDADVLARVTIAARTSPSVDAQRMLVAAARRRETLVPFRATRVPGALVKAFANECRRERTIMRVVVGDERDVLASLLAPVAERPQLLAGSPLFLTITTSGDAPPDWLSAGRALSAVLLRATEQGMSTSQFEAIVREPSLRSSVAALVRSERTPQALLRCGHYDGPSVAAPPRALLDDLIVL